MMPNIDIEDKEVFNDIMVDLEEIEEVDKHHENYVSFLNLRVWMVLLEFDM